MAKARRQVGKNPGEGWALAGTVVSLEGDDWLVYVRRNPDTEWQSIKVVSAERVPGRANYWFGWDGRRFSLVRDAQELDEQRDLLGAVQEVLELNDLL